MLRAFREVENALTSEELLAQQSVSDQRTLNDRVEAVRIAAIKYKVGTIDMLSMLILQADEFQTQAAVICATRDSPTASPCTLPWAVASAPRQRRRRECSQ